MWWVAVFGFHILHLMGQGTRSVKLREPSLNHKICHRFSQVCHNRALGFMHNLSHWHRYRTVKPPHVVPLSHAQLATECSSWHMVHTHPQPLSQRVRLLCFHLYFKTNTVKCSCLRNSLTAVDSRRMQRTSNTSSNSR
jgi:hypothetical protein